MGQVISYLYDLYVQIFYTRCRVAFCGLSNSGKTSIIYVLAGKLQEPKMSLYPQLEETTYNSLALKLFDVGSRGPSYRMLEDWLQYLEAIIYTVDGADRDLIDESKEEFEKCLAYPEVEGLPIVIMVTKQDLPGCLTVSEIEKSFELSQYTKNPIHLIPSTIKDRSSIFEALKWIEGRLNKGKREE